MVIIEFKKHHFVFAVRAFQGIIAEGRKNGGAPLVKTSVYRMFAFGYSPIEFGINGPMSCIEAAIVFKTFRLLNPIMLCCKRSHVSAYHTFSITAG